MWHHRFRISLFSWRFTFVEMFERRGIFEKGTEKRLMLYCLSTHQFWAYPISVSVCTEPKQTADALRIHNKNNRQTHDNNWSPSNKMPVRKRNERWTMKLNLPWLGSALVASFFGLFIFWHIVNMYTWPKINITNRSNYKQIANST